MEFSEFFQEVREKIFDSGVDSRLSEIAKEMARAKADGRTVFFFGNGASAAISSHCAIDFLKQAGIKTNTCHDVSVLTALANDYGFDQCFAKYLALHCGPGDVVVVISVSGVSENGINVIKEAKSRGLSTISLTGRRPDNVMHMQADIGLHVPSDAYNVVEGIHMLWITSVVDKLLGRSVYEVS